MPTHIILWYSAFTQIYTHWPDRNDVLASRQCLLHIIVVSYIVDDYWSMCVAKRRNVRVVPGYIVDDFSLTVVGGGGGSYCSWLYCGRLLLDVYGGEEATIVFFPFQLTQCFLVFISASAKFWVNKHLMGFPSENSDDMEPDIVQMDFVPQRDW